MSLPTQRLKGRLVKELFQTISTLGEGNWNVFDIILLDIADSITYRVHCGDIGSFQISKEDGEEDWDMKEKAWVYVDGIVYKYISLSIIFDDYINLPLEVAADFINRNIKQSL